MQHAGAGFRTIESAGYWAAAGRREEGREVVGAIAHHRHSLSLQILEGPRNIEQTLGAGADHSHGSASKLRKIGADVKSDVTVAMYASQAARDKYSDAG
jgi:hypothetical protein